MREEVDLTMKDENVEVKLSSDRELVIMIIDELTFCILVLFCHILSLSTAKSRRSKQSITEKD